MVNKGRYQSTDFVSCEVPDQSLNQSMPLTITENSEDCILDHACMPRRCKSLPMYLNKSILKRRTLDESLHSTYGSEDGLINGNSKKNLSLQFDKIEIREYDLTVGDNPACTSGPPVSISWDYHIIGDIDLNEYERTRSPRREKDELILPRHTREDLLRYEWEESRKDITESIRQNVRVKNQRRTTVNNLGKATVFEEAMESAKRKLKRFVTRQKPVHKQVRDLEKQIDMTNRRRSKIKYLEHNMSQGGEEMAPTEKVSIALSGSGDSIAS